MGCVCAEGVEWAGEGEAAAVDRGGGFGLVHMWKAGERYAPENVYCHNPD